MTEQPTDPANKARDAFLDVYRQDIAAGRRRTLDDYQQQFAGHEETIAQEWAWLEPASVNGQEAQHRRVSRPDVIGPYRVLEELGRGAQATVYLAEHQKLHRRVALKVLHASATLDDTTTQRRFRREAEATAGLEHPGICSIYETGRSDGQTWIAMQHVAGATLAAHLQRAREPGSSPTVRLPLRESQGSTESSGSSSRGTMRSDLMRVVAFFEQTALALDAAHEQGLVHRDVKPGNLIVRDDGQPVVLDFGLAHDDDGHDLGLTRSTDVLGTPYYMAPEQLRHDSKNVDRRADIWALGVTLYECLAGRRPFSATSRESLYRQILSEEPAAPRLLNPQVSHDLEVVVLTALDKDPDRRYQTAADFAEDLRRVRCYEPIQAKPVSTWGRVWRWSRRHPAVALSSSIAVLSLLIGLGVSLFLQTRLASTLTSARALGLASAASKEVASNPACAMLLALEAIALEDRIETRSALHQTLARCREEVYFPTEGSVISADALPDGSKFVTGSVGGFVQCWSRDGELEWQYQHPYDNSLRGDRRACMLTAFVGEQRDRVVAAFRDGELRMWDLSGQLLDEYAPSPQKDVSYCGHSRTAAATGSQFLIGFDGSVQLLKIVGPTRDQLEQAQSFPKPGAEGVWSCSDDWQWIATSNGKRRNDAGNLWQRRADGHYERVDSLLESDQKTGLYGLAFSKSRLLIGMQGHDSVCFDIAKDTRTYFGSGGAQLVSWLAGDRFVAGSEGGKPLIWDQPGAPAITPAARPDDRSVLTGSSIATSQGGTMFATCNQTGSIQVFEAPLPTSPADSTEPRLQYTLRGHFGLPAGAMFTNGDRELFSWSSGARLWNLQSDLEWQGLNGSLAFSPEPEGSRLLAGWQLLDADRQAVGKKLRGAGKWAGGACFSSDGKYVSLRSDGKYVSRRSGPEIHVYATADGTLIDRHPAKDKDGAVCMVPDSSEVLYLDIDHEVATFHNYLTGKNRPGPTLGCYAWGAACSPDGNSIAVIARPNQILLFRQTATGWTRHAVRDVFETMRMIVYSPEGDQILVGADDGRIHAFDADLRATNLPFVGHRQRITCIRYSRCGQLIATTAKDGSARLWHKDGTALAVLEVDGGGMQICAFTPDGRHVLTSGGKVVRKWFLHTEDLIAAAKARTRRELLPAERAKYAELLGDR